MRENDTVLFLCDRAVMRNDLLKLALLLLRSESIIRYVSSFSEVAPIRVSSIFITRHIIHAWKKTWRIIYLKALTFSVCKTLTSSLYCLLMESQSVLLRGLFLRMLSKIVRSALFSKILSLKAASPKVSMLFFSSDHFNLDEHTSRCKWLSLKR